MPTKVRSANNMYNKFVSILNEEYLKYSNSAPKLIQTDKGTQFALVKKKYGKDNRLFHTHSREIKGSMVEGLIRELKQMMRRFLTVIHYLDAIVEQYNKAPCSLLGDNLH